jgi:hypothetical protein
MDESIILHLFILLDMEIVGYKLCMTTIRTSIPFVDLRGKTPLDLLRAYPDRARSLIVEGRRTYGVFSYMLSALLVGKADRMSLDWLKRSQNPYLHEIESFSDVLGVKGLYALNLSYEWGCTTGAYRSEETVSMLRVLDWPLAGLGKYIVVALQQAKAGEFYNITWPGFSGVCNAMAPGRFAAAVNLAPMRDHGKGLAGNWWDSRKRAFTETGLPPMHLLRQVFERAKDYNEAKDMLTNIPLAVPAIFTLTGMEMGQGCVIERTETQANTRELGAESAVAVSNQFETGLGQGMLVRPLFDSPGRYKAASGMQAYDFEGSDFAFLKLPILNAFTRVAIITDAATGKLIVQGFEGATPVTHVFSLPSTTQRSHDNAAFAVA